MTYTINRHSRSNSNSRPNSGRSFSTRINRGGGNRHQSNSSRRGGRKMPTFNPAQFINKNPADIQAEIYAPTNSFKTFGFNDKLVKTITSLGLTIPSPIQDQIIPEIMQGRDVIGIAETGTGKTAAFLLPLIEKTLAEPKRQTLILTPTRELALQIENELRLLSQGLRIFGTTCVGGINIRPQIRALSRHNHFIIGTPGRVLDLINRGCFKTQHVTSVVLDEADRMLDMGFITDIRTILSSTPKDRETLFFSATTSKQTDAITKDFLQDPVTISVKKKDVTNSIEQDVVSHGPDNKFETLLNLFSDLNLKRVIIFGAMKHGVEKLSQELSRHNIKADSIHGNKNHTQRQRALREFKNGNTRVLVATDVAARGIHVDNVSHVINYDLPNTFEDYVHRIGRTGRGDKFGKALTFVPHSK
ncbi:MAG: DEAD/DEAH box helicase [Candidatus Paceibacterota bacterium]